MKVLLTGANGFVGSHILDRLRAAGVATRLLLRSHSDTTFIQAHLPACEIARGSLEDPAALARAVDGVTHVVHAAGATKALTPAGLYAANQHGTRNLVQALGSADPGRRLILLSSLAVSGPGTRAQPAREDQPPRPLSEYARSKLAAERELEALAPNDFVILRLAAVYGPRDREFLRLFRVAARGWTPLFDGGRQELSLVWAPDVAEVVWRALTAPPPEAPVVQVAGPEPVTAAQLAAAIAQALGRRARRLRLPRAVLPVVCGLAAGWARWSRRATLLAHGKHRELTAPGWVADIGRLRRWLGEVCATPLAEGLAATARWYREAGWL
jgi:nucleoside-diphosphate-sugar epimerase